MSRQNQQPPKQYIPGTSIEYRPPRDIWAEQGVYVTNNEIHRGTPTATPNTNEATPERRPFWKR